MRGIRQLSNVKWQTKPLQPLRREWKVKAVHGGTVIPVHRNHTLAIAEEGDPKGAEAEVKAEGARFGMGKQVLDRIKPAVVIRGVRWGVGNINKRKRNDEQQAAKRLKMGEDGEYANAQFSKEEIEAEGRKPKRKVAVLIGYAGSGYKGMQINGQEKTIEGDIFKAFIAAGAISKANADDPKKSSLVRCARTDKGVHAAGNVISLKLIVEDPDVVQKINDNLPPQIRVWGTERTNGAFSCYQSCDSRWYEYLIPTYSFLPPQPQSFMGKKLVESAEKKGTLEEYKARQADVADFWQKAEDEYIKPILDQLDPETRETVMAAVYSSEEPIVGNELKQKVDKLTKAEDDLDIMKEEPQKPEIKSDQNMETLGSADEAATQKPEVVESKDPTDTQVQEIQTEAKIIPEVSGDSTMGVPQTAAPEDQEASVSKSILSPVDIAIKQVKAAYIKAKKAYRISESRRQKVQETLDCYLGTRNFHNYTIQKTFSDPSAKRVIRSFKVGPEPIYINDTEWLSLKVHGQSFMMHQIRKMVAMAALVVRCGTEKHVIQESYGTATISIPKAPGLGLLLERPVFDSYNEQAVTKFSREKIDFDKFQKEMDEFKQREIYDRIFREEEKDHQFHTFFHHIDHYRTDFFLWVTAEGIAASRQSKSRSEVLDDVSDSEPDANGQEG
ncbi:tRNA pseudouridine synthase A [Venustampulla echinocandica]|uniref:tRNA pseudouridine synthase 1 n=1 Tax=Venustampulla echinocandica TaxID=2656787 RepID=A0A370T9C5_9HELO|nr:tRNA pseudouridine synthase A [Venustampulla echinocandica]RDL30172.1 tRNA pseudouridine synthase A [Venustampulla echinocandica]